MTRAAIVDHYFHGRRADRTTCYTLTGAGWKRLHVEAWPGCVLVAGVLLHKGARTNTRKCVVALVNAMQGGFQSLREDRHALRALRERIDALFAARRTLRAEGLDTATVDARLRTLMDQRAVLADSVWTQHARIIDAANLVDARPAVRARSNTRREA